MSLKQVWLYYFPPYCRLCGAVPTTHKTATPARKVDDRAVGDSLHSRAVAARSPGKAKSHKLHGQQAIQSSRVMEIQQALIREHYLTGEANGNWDSSTQAAMQKYPVRPGMADQGDP